MKSTALCILLAFGTIATGPAARSLWAAPSPDATANPAQPASAPASQPASQPADSSGDALLELRLLTPVLGAGVVLLGWWLLGLLMGSCKLTLKDSPQRPNALEPLHIVGLLFLWILPGSLLAGAAQKYGGEYKVQFGIAAILFVQALIAGVCLTVSARMFPKGIRNGLGLTVRNFAADLRRAAFTYLCVMPVVMGLAWFSQMLIPREMQHLNDMLTSLRLTGWGGRSAVIVSAVVLAPLTEEIFFRGIVQSMVRNQSGSAWLAVGISSAVFALMHFSSAQDVIPLVALAVALGYSYEKTGRLAAPLLIHATFNAVMLAVYMKNAGIL